jgi:hypothetical protein
MMTEATTFESWAMVEIMGHQQFAGYVTTQVIGGASLIRVDVPEIEVTRYGETKKIEPFTKMFGSASIYCITPCDEATARRAAQSYQSIPFATYVAPTVVALPPPEPEELEAGQDDDSELEDDDDIPDDYR